MSNQYTIEKIGRGKFPKLHSRRYQRYSHQRIEVEKMRKGLEIGKATEERVRRLVHTYLPRKRWFVAYRVANESEDIHDGIDAFIVVRYQGKAVELPIQIKTSNRWNGKYRRKRPRSTIPVVIGGGRADKVIESLIRVVEDFYQSKNAVPQ